MINPINNPNFRMVSHQGFSVTDQWLGNSRVSSYIGSAEQGFKWAETDIKFTADNIPVCCHDFEFTDSHDGKTRIVIGEHTLAELKTYGYYGEEIATFDEVLYTCKTHGLSLYIDHLDPWDDARWNTLFSLVLKYKMEDHVAWLSDKECVISRVLAWDPTAEISLVSAQDDITYLIEWAKKYKTEFNKFSINIIYTKHPVEEIIALNQRLPRGVRLEVWIIDEPDIMYEYLPYVSGFTTNTISPKDL